MNREASRCRACWSRACANIPTRDRPQPQVRAKRNGRPAASGPPSVPRTSGTGAGVRRQLAPSPSGRLGMSRKAESPGRRRNRSSSSSRASKATATPRRLRGGGQVLCTQKGVGSSVGRRSRSDMNVIGSKIVDRYVVRGVSLRHRHHRGRSSRPRAHDINVRTTLIRYITVCQWCSHSEDHPIAVGLWPVTGGSLWNL
jgi:hypothetical protein